MQRLRSFIAESLYLAADWLERLAVWCLGPAERARRAGEIDLSHGSIVDDLARYYAAALAAESRPRPDLFAQYDRYQDN